MHSPLLSKAQTMGLRNSILLVKSQRPSSRAMLMMSLTIHRNPLSQVVVSILKIYVDQATNLTYRWTDLHMLKSPHLLHWAKLLPLLTVVTVERSLMTTSQATHARTDATKTEASVTNGNIKIDGTEVTVYTHPSGTNPHGTTKSDVGLGNVGNFKAVSTVASQGLTDTEKSNARTNIGAGTSSLTLGSTATTVTPGIIPIRLKSQPVLGQIKSR